MPRESRFGSPAVFMRAIALAIFAVATIAAAQTQSDFVYTANPPRVQVSKTAVVPSAIPFCGSGLICYSPGFIRSAYNYPDTLNGAGQTIVIVDAIGSPTIRHDLEMFDSVFGISAPPSFQILCPEGCPTFNPLNAPQADVGWSFETTLDVEYAHAMAPGANIVLVVAPTPFGSAINTAERAAIAQFPGSIMSQSFGVFESSVRGNNAQILQAEKNYAAAKAANITVLASAGDWGATNLGTTPNAVFPASDPLVTAIGGTQGLPYPGGLAGCSTTTCSGTYGGEQVWNEPQFDSATGGAPSLLFSAPSYQSAIGLTRRTTPDISYNAAIDGGVLVYYSAVPSLAGFWIIGGTSAGSPQWAAIFALANQSNGGPLGFVNPAIYALARNSTSYANDFHDITVGNNKLVNTPAGFSAATGWDDASGWGTPDVTNFVNDLVAHH